MQEENSLHDKEAEVFLNRGLREALQPNGHNILLSVPTSLQESEPRPRMLFWRRGKAQSIIEYAVLLAVVLSALLLLQAIVKRGYSGGLREASDRMGEQYSPTNTTTRVRRTMPSDQFINEEVNTKTSDATHVGMDDFIPLIPGFGYTPKYVGDMGAYNYTERLGQKFTTTSEEKTDSASKELFRWDEYNAQATTWPDFTDPFTIGP